jgi:hypothetical protein
VVRCPVARRRSSRALAAAAKHVGAWVSSSHSSSQSNNLDSTEVRDLDMIVVVFRFAAAAAFA